MHRQYHREVIRTRARAANMQYHQQSLSQNCDQDKILLPAIPLAVVSAGVGAIAWICVYYFAIYKRKKDKEIGQIQNSAEYKSQCAAADREFDKMQEKADADYQVQKQEYETETNAVVQFSNYGIY